MTRMVPQEFVGGGRLPGQQCFPVSVQRLVLLSRCRRMAPAVHP